MTTDLEELERLHAAATGAMLTLAIQTNGLSIHSHAGHVVFEDYAPYPKLSDDDARALVSAHNAIPGLLAELRALREVARAALVAEAARPAIRFMAWDERCASASLTAALAKVPK